MTDFDKIKREPLLDEALYTESVRFKTESFINRTLEDALTGKSESRSYREGRSWDWASAFLELLIQMYSGGVDIEELKPCAKRMFEFFEQHKLNFPEFHLEPWEPDAYQYILWLLSLAVLFDMPERVAAISSLVSDTSEQGRDSLLRQLFARAGAEVHGDKLIHDKPYSELQAAINTSGDEQRQLMGRYLKHWYQNMKSCYWYGRDKRPISGFFGYWAFEAGMVTVLWDIDDTVYRDLPYYPKDLVDYARAKHVADHFTQGRLIGAPGMTAKSGEECPCTGVWTCDDWAVGPQTFSRGITLPTDSGRQVTWRLTKVI
ncbi:PoNi-like cognate immunity protein [Pseudomonas fontis]|uniref:PoNi-like cognate immunity protein n=1 Tax=Pseudomonas fontis TaxID=2942633 RepID=A0ABT5P1A2_9PSED|nr:PoNi-like cognate immunity protein [Pseudomonas fontis]MDD0977005.1 PoNi-like cognate immunity protein [Pseudomonas fontis]MDD0994238.1 PoNi-like cognate immunity protein [Pseudomonas fontis]